MDRDMRYVMLITSLPYHGPLFVAKQTPLSRLRLRDRLKILEEADSENLLELVSVLDWAHHSMELTDATLIKRTQCLEQLWGEGFLTEMLRFRMELRTLLVALRRRHRGETAAPDGELWGYGRWVRHIERNWNEPGFGLQLVYPWVTKAENLLQVEDSLALERLRLSVAWEQLIRISEGHEFDFEAVVIYVLRWDLIARWSSYDGEQAIKRFDTLVEQGLGEYDSLFEAPLSRAKEYVKERN
jgi:hypothetical protein